ncbi:MAG: metallophosphoesterase [Acidimicrobiales bacterium]|nr:metallophosphoesterase [Acidimicrobiales bacterium]
MPFPRLLAVLRTTVLALVGAGIAVVVAGSVQVPFGPFDTTLSARPALSGETLVRLAPLGTIELDTHDAPIGLTLRVDELRLTEAERIAADPAVLESLEDDIAADARHALERIALRCAVVAVIGGALFGFAASPRLRSLAHGAATGAAFAGVLGTATFITFDADAVAEPEYSGLLTVAPTAVGDVEGIVDRFGEYQAQLTDLVGNVVTLYRTAQGLPTFGADDDTIRVLHVSDIHLNPQAFDVTELLVEQFDIDAVADTGDTTDWGSDPETRLLDRIGDLDVPYVWVRGNHDSSATQRAIAAQPNAVVLDGEAATVAGLRFWGTADTRYTPNKEQESGPEVEESLAEAAASDAARELEEAQPPAVDVALLHDPRTAADIGGDVPLVLAGHTHEAKERSIGATRLLVEGSTGGAGLRGLQAEDPEPLTATVLYFDPDTNELVAYDRITIDGLGETGARIDRHVVDRVRDADD